MTKIGIATAAVALLGLAANSAMAAVCYWVYWYDAFGNLYYRYICY